MLFLFLMSAVHPKGPKESVTEPAIGEMSTYLPSREDALSVLFVGVGANGAESGTFVLARFDPARGAVPVVALPAHTAVRNRDRTETLAQVYKYGGAGYTRGALQQTLGITIDRYVRMDQAAFLIAAATVGSVEYDLPQEVVLEQQGAAMTLGRGRQLLDGQRVSDLISYRGYEGGELGRSAAVSALVAEIVNQRLDIALSTVVDKVFEKIINLVDTDISYVDYDDRKQAAEFLAKLGQNPAVPMEVAGRYSDDGELFTLSDTFVALLVQTFS